MIPQRHPRRAHVEKPPKNRGVVNNPDSPQRGELYIRIFRVHELSGLPGYC